MKLLLIPILKNPVTIAVALVMSLGAAGAFAAQEAAPSTSGQSTLSLVGQELTPSPTPSDVEEATATSTPVEEVTATPTPIEEMTATPTEVGEATATPTEAAEATPTPAEGEGQREVVGIPTDNPSHHPENGDGVCDKGETVIKIVPSGKQVNVPCQAAKPHGPKGPKHDNEATPTPEETEQP